ncbi:MAG: hypothetical protein HXX17_08820 [Geobacteraceae bacterium]|nr:hypothetical protein [Geobacteraceae bacterium]
MKLKNHLIATTLVASPILALSSPVETAAFCVGSVLIDFDHQIYYTLKTGRYDIAGMFRFFREAIDEHLYSIPYIGVCIFHTAEFFLTVAILSIFFPLLKYLLAGLIFHIMLDIFDLIRLKVPFIRAYSLVEHLIRRRMNGYPFV